MIVRYSKEDACGKLMMAITNNYMHISLYVSSKPPLPSKPPLSFTSRPDRSRIMENTSDSGWGGGFPRHLGSGGGFLDT